MHLTRAFRHAGRSIATLLLAAGASFAAIAAAPTPTGKPVVLEGELDVLVEDFANGNSRTRHFLKTDHGRRELRFSRKPTTLPSGTRVRVRGRVEAGGVMALDGAETGSVQTLAAQVPHTLGEQKVAVLLVNFQDDTSQPVTHDSARDKVFGTAGTYYQENSFGQTWLSGDVHGWFTVPMSKTICDAFQMADLADQQAIAAGIDLAAYPRKLYIFPKTACQWSGMGNLGGSETRAWANGSTTMIVIGHELGHNLGLYHAQALNCDVAALGDTCTNLMYGDTADLMGNYRAAHFNPFAKERLGWLNDGISPPIATVASSGRYAIEPYSSDSVGTKAIKVPRGTDASGRRLWYYLEYRQPTGADAVLANTGNTTQGVVVRMATEGDPASSRQLDMTPGTSTNTYTELADGALAVGQTYTDAVANVTLTLVSASATGATVDVSLVAAPAPTCVRVAPDLNISGPNTAVTAGSTVSYTVSLINRDSSACAPTTFLLARSILAGWTGTLGSSSLSLSPGANGSTTLSVTSAQTATAGAHVVGVGSSSSVGSVHTAYAAITYAVAAPATALTETIGVDKSSYVRGETVYMSALVKNNGAVASGASVKFIVSLPGGSSTTLTATSGSDGYARATYKLGKGKGATGQYALRADATLGAGTATASASFSVR